LKISARDLADISRAAVDGLAQLASIDVENAPRYRALIEKLFVLLAELMLEPAGEDEGPPQPPS
jgi:hypothetical protein